MKRFTYIATALALALSIEAQGTDLGTSNRPAHIAVGLGIGLTVDAIAPPTWTSGERLLFGTVLALGIGMGFELLQAAPDEADALATGIGGTLGIGIGIVLGF